MACLYAQALNKEGSAGELFLKGTPGVALIRETHFVINRDLSFGDIIEFTLQ